MELLIDKLCERFSEKSYHVKALILTLTDYSIKVQTNLKNAWKENEKWYCNSGRFVWVTT